MKKVKTLIGLMLFFFILPGCIQDQVVTTTFAPDGSSDRVVSFISDEETYDLSSLNIPVDSTWTIREERDTSDTSRIQVYAEKHFRTVAEINQLNDSLQNNFSGVRREITWKTQFRWFYTVYKYSETIYAIFNQHPMSDYLSPEEIKYALAGDEERDSLFRDLDSTALKKLDEAVDEKGWKWISACTFDEFYAGLLKTAAEHPEGKFTENRVKESKATMVEKFDNMNDSVFNVLFSSLFGIVNPDSLVNAYPDNFHSFTQLEDVVGRTFGEEYDNKIVMPGLLVHTNAEKKEKGVLTWNVGSMKFMGSDFTMVAVSRKTNKWAFYVAALVVIMAVLCWLVPATRKKKK